VNRVRPFRCTHRCADRGFDHRKTQSAVAAVTVAQVSILRNTIRPHHHRRATSTCGNAVKAIHAGGGGACSNSRSGIMRVHQYVGHAPGSGPIIRQKNYSLFAESQPAVSHVLLRNAHPARFACGNPSVSAQWFNRTVRASIPPKWVTSALSSGFPERSALLHSMCCRLQQHAHAAKSQGGKPSGSREPR